ncbi:MAG: hypothetical protein L6R39_006544 [Caloplaca ligustica]|nr:MAG: hypothetical protein L6R39_006544 [Caloplaca ligustica]
MASNGENEAVRTSSSQDKPTSIRSPDPDPVVQRQSNESDAQLLSTCITNSLNNPRKRPSASNNSSQVDIAHHGPSLSEVSNGADPHPQKRTRRSDWSIEVTQEPSARSAITRRSNRAPSSPSQRLNQAIKPRPSRFLEGSMNDRTSAKPPSIYTRDGTATGRRHNPASSRGLDSYDTIDMDDDKTHYDAAIESAKPSGMYRFGKALVTAFNPANVWQGINGIWRDKEQPTPAEKSILQARKAKAEKAYAELKRNGLQGTEPFSTRAPDNNQSHVTGRSSQKDSLDSNSYAMVVRPHTPTVFKHGRPTAASSEDLLIPPLTTEPRPPPPSPINWGKTGRKTSIDLRRPSFQSLKKVKSQIQLPSTKRKLTEAFLSPGSDHVPIQNNPQGLKRQPSKKDIAKQRKLSKQVSDLEDKLEAARRELQLCTNGIPDVPKIVGIGRRSVEPRTLPSLPSESNLESTYSSAQDESDPDWQPSSSRKKRAKSSTPRKPASKASAVKTPNTAEGRKLAGQDLVLISSDRKRKSSGGRTSNSDYKPGQKTDHESDCDVSVSTKKVPRTRKSQQLDEGPAFRAREAKDWSRPGAETVPPVLKLTAPFDPTKVDQKKLLAMRSVPKDDLPFGSHLDDIVNLQKEFPHCSQKQLDVYLSSLSKEHSVTEQSGDIDGKPSSVSPTKESSSNGGPVNPRQVCKNSSPNKKMARELSTIEEAIITMDPSKDKTIPPMPKPLFPKVQGAYGSGGPKGKGTTDKPLPVIQKENYEWPEDVF